MVEQRKNCREKILLFAEYGGVCVPGYVFLKIIGF